MSTQKYNCKDIHSLGNSDLCDNALCCSLGLGPPPINTRFTPRLALQSRFTTSHNIVHYSILLYAVLKLESNIMMEVVPDKATRA